MKRIWLIALVLAGTAGVGKAGWIDWLLPPPVVIVKGTTSVPDAGERIFAASLADQAGAWLDETGIRHKFLTDEQVTPWTLRGAHAVILPYNPNPTGREMEAFQSALRSGSILLVFYGMDPGLATLMGVKIAPYRRAETQGQWSGFTFDRTLMPGLPAAIRQSSSHLVPVLPDGGGTLILARWASASGMPAAEAAWVKSPAGFWMSHVLLPGDDENKKQMLIAMLATVLPDAWQKATDKLLDPERPFGHYHSLHDARQALGWTDSAVTNLGTPDSYLAARTMRTALAGRYAAEQSFARAFPLRGIWMDDNTLYAADTWPIRMTSLQSNGINTVFFHMGNAFLPTHAPPPSPLSIHAWFTCLNIENITPEQLRELESQHRLQVSDAGTLLPWLCPTHPDNHQLLIKALVRMAGTGRFAGIQLDYIRYQNIHSCYCEGCRERFQKETGQRVGDWPQQVRTGNLAPAYSRWRAEKITVLVATLSQAIRAAAPSMKVSAAVYGGTPSCYFTVGQDWPRWLEQGLLDFACPMNYTSGLGQFEKLLKTQAALPCANRIIPGLGLASSQSRLPADQTVAQLILVRQYGFPGFALFEYSPDIADRLPSYTPTQDDPR